MRTVGQASLAGALLLLIAGPAPAQAPARPVGYLAADELPDALALLPPPPADGSPAALADRAAFEGRTRGGPRWDQAIADVAILEPTAFQSWSCAAQVAITPTGTPLTYRLLRNVVLDAGVATNRPKEHYNRPRPFVGNEAPVCTPRETLRNSASYPSGHASVGWAWALVLAELKPERAQAILTRGRDFGESRLVCGVHYPSDIEAGRLYGAAAVARLHADAEFQADLAAAKAELAKATARPEGCPSP